MGESELDTFITGFRLGARFMMDTFLSEVPSRFMRKNVCRLS